MDKIPDNVLNPSLYKKAKAIVYPRYKRPSAYRSMALQKEYIKLGGKYSGEKKYSLSAWRKEEWVSMKDYLKGKKVICGDDKIGNNACRPSKRISAKTPITADEVIKKHGKEAVQKAVNKKVKNMNLTLNWNTLKFS
jgi:hypothetical protein